MYSQIIKNTASVLCSVWLVFPTHHLFKIPILVKNTILTCNYDRQRKNIESGSLSISHRGQNSKQINIAKYVSKFLIYGGKMLDKCVKSQKKFFVHCPFLQSQAK